MATWQMYRSGLQRTVIVRGRGTVSSYCLRVAPGPPRYRPRRTFLSLVSPARPSSWGGCFREAPSAPRVTPPFPSPPRSTLRSSSLDAPCSRLPRCLPTSLGGRFPTFFHVPHYAPSTRAMGVSIPTSQGRLGTLGHTASDVAPV